MPRLYPHHDGIRIKSWHTDSQREIAKALAAVIIRFRLDRNYKIDSFGDVYLTCEFDHIKGITGILRLMGVRCDFA